MSFQCPIWPPNSPEIESSISEIVASGDWGRYKSPHQEVLRKKLRDLTQTEHVRLCGSGSGAVEIALRAAGIGAGDEVVVAAYDYPGNLRAIEAVGARPVLVDVDSDQPVMNTAQVEQISKESPTENSVRAVLASHLYGIAAPMQRLAKICQQREWILVEDACQVPGMMIDGRPAGSLGDISAISFGGSKPVTAGNGGALLTNNTRLSARMNAFLDRPSDSHPLSTLQAAVLIPQLSDLGQFNVLRQATVAHIESSVNVSLEGWTWLSKTSANVSATHYKVAWSCSSSDKRKRIIDEAARLGVPIGAGFRAMSRTSERRCRKPHALDNSIRFGETTIVLDHAALLLQSEMHNELANALIEVNLMA